MCGIIAVRRHDNKKPHKTLLKRYAAQRNRGYEGFGFVSMKEGKLVGYHRAEEEKTIIDKLKETDADDIMFHHRWPTSTENYAEAAHPIKVSDERLKFDYYVVHNGVIINDEEARKKHQADKWVYTTEIVCEYTENNRVLQKEYKYNDSEALAIELAIDLEKDGEGIALRGSIAFICLKVNKETGKVVSMYWGRNDNSPLVYQHLPNQMTVISSEGMGVTVRPHTLYEYDYELKTTSERKYQVGEVFQTKIGYQYPRQNSVSHAFENIGADQSEKDDAFLDSLPYDDDPIPLSYSQLVHKRKKVSDDLDDAVASGQVALAGVLEEALMYLDDELEYLEEIENKYAKEVEAEGVKLATITQ